MANPLISFVVPCFNHAHFLEEGLDSIFKQTLQTNFEVIVADDCSTDETPVLMQRYSDSRVIYVRHEKNLGYAGNLSVILPKTRGEFIAQLDSDDRYRLNFLEITLPVMQAHPKLSMVYGDVAAMDQTGSVYQDPWETQASYQIHRRQIFMGDGLEFMLFGSPAPASARLMRGDLLRAEAPFPSFIHPRFIAIDWYLNVRLARQHQVYYVAKTLTDYRIHPANHFNRPLREFDEEQSVIGTLDQLCDEKTPLMRSRKFRNRAYCEAYLRLGNRYFGGGRYADARRCYIHTLWFQPKTFLQAGGLHRLIGTTLGTERYAYLKQQIRRVKPHD